MLTAVSVRKASGSDISLNCKHIPLVKEFADVLSGLAPGNTSDKVRRLVSVCIAVNRKAEIRADVSVGVILKK